MPLGWTGSTIQKCASSTDDEWELIERGGVIIHTVFCNVMVVTADPIRFIRLVRSGTECIHTTLRLDSFFVRQNPSLIRSSLDYRYYVVEDEHSREHVVSDVEESLSTLWWMDYRKATTNGCSRLAQSQHGRSIRQNAAQANR